MNSHLINEDSSRPYSDLTSSIPRVSVIIPSYRVADTLKKAVESVIDQTEKDLEIIIVDDASPDGTWNVACQLKAYDARIRIEKLTKNHGKSYVMNFATGLARGKWIAILDADDWFAPNRIERLIAAAEVCGVEMAADNLYFIDKHADLCAGTAFPCRGSQRLVDLDTFLKMSKPTENYDFGMLQPIFRADFIREHSIEYYEPARIAEDFYQLLCFFVVGGRAVVLDTPFYYYVQPFGTISRQWSHETRSRYNFESMLETHNHFSGILRSRLNGRQRRLLDRRKAGIEAMISFHQIRECIVRNDFKGAFIRIFMASPRFWQVILNRLSLRIRKLCSPRKGVQIL